MSVDGDGLRALQRILPADHLTVVGSFLEEGDPSKAPCRCKSPAKTKCANVGKLLAGIVAVVGHYMQREPLAILVFGPPLCYQYMQVTTAHKAGFGSKISEAVKTGDGSKISEAVKAFLQPYEIADPEEQVVKRDIMETIKELVRTWSHQTRLRMTTVVTGRYRAGTKVALNEALRGVRGVLQVSVRDAGWEEKMYKELGVGDYGMFKQVLRRVAVELQKLPNSPMNYPILLLEVTHESPLGALPAFAAFFRGCKCQAHEVSNSFNNGRRRSDGDRVQHGEGFGNRCCRQCTNPRPTFCMLSLA